MSSSGRKIASVAVKNRRSTPFFEWLRNKFLAIERDPRTPPPGVSKEGEVNFKLLNKKHYFIKI